MCRSSPKLQTIAIRSPIQHTMWEEARPKPRKTNWFVRKSRPPIGGAGIDLEKTQDSTLPDNMPLVTSPTMVLPKEEGKGSGPLDRPKGKWVKYKPPVGMFLCLALYMTGGANPKSLDFHVAPSNPHSVAEPQLPSLKDHTAYWKSCFDFLAIPKQKYLTYVVDWAQTVGCSNAHKLIANCPFFWMQRPTFVLFT